MLPEKVKKANIAAAIYFATMLAMTALVPSSGHNIFSDGNLVAISVYSVSILSFLMGLYFYAEAKGYNGFVGVGLAFLFVVGLAILLFLKDKHKLDEQESASPNAQWKIYLGVLALALAIGTFLLDQHHPGPDAIRAAYAIGFYFVPAIALAVIFYAIVGRGGGSRVGISTFLVVYASLIVGALLSYELRPSQEKEALEGVVDILDGLLEERLELNPDGTPALIDRTFSADPNLSGSLAVMQQFIADLANQSAAITNDYTRELGAIGVYSILDADRLAGDHDFSESRAIIAETEQVITLYEARFDGLVDDALARIDALDLSEAEKQDMRTGFQRGLGQSEATRSRMWELERQIMREFSLLIDMFEADSWVFENGELIYETDEQLEQYNRHLDKIDALYLEQVRLQQDAVDRQRQRVDELF